MENLNNVFILFTEEESKKISFLEDNKEKILNNYIENDNIDSKTWIFNFIENPAITSKIMELLLNSGIKNNINCEFNNCIDFYLTVLKSIEFDSFNEDKEEIFFYGETDKHFVSIVNCYYPILVFQDKNFYYLIEIYDKGFSLNLYLLNKENNENIFHKLLMDMSL